MNRLHVDSIRKQFNNRQILNDVFISCEPGQIVGLLGRNGSGKSTLLKIIFGAVKAEYKFVSVDHVKTDSLFSNRAFINYLPQSGFLPGHVNIRNIISCFCCTEQSDLLQQNEFVSPYLQLRPGQLSGGERRLVEILIMLHSGAKYLLFDEPFHGLSPLYIEAIKNMIKSHSAETGFIITDHDYRHVLEISSKVILLDNGNTKPVQAHGDLISLGYLPSNSQII